MTRSPRLCRIGLHKWRRRPVLVDGDGSLQWFAMCDRCDAYRDRYDRQPA